MKGDFMEKETEAVKVKLTNGVAMYIQATTIDKATTLDYDEEAVFGEEVAFTAPSFKQVVDAIEGIAESLVTTLEKVKPRKASIEFGLQVALESGKLTALLVKGTGTSNLKILLEWGE